MFALTTCISFAMLGELKSTSTLETGSTGGCTPCWMMLAMQEVSVAPDRVMLMKPLGAEVVLLTIGFTGMAQMMRSATSLGDTGPARDKKTRKNGLLDMLKRKQLFIKYKK